jgi:TonB family protein
MKKLFVALLLLTIVPTVKAQNADTVIIYLRNIEKRLPGAEGALLYMKGVRQGANWYAVTRFIASDSIYSTGCYSDRNLEVMHGEFLYYRKNGQCFRREQYFANQKTGTWKTWHENGQLSDSANYVNNKKQGLSVRWNKNGEPTDSLWLDEKGAGRSVSYWEKNIKSSEGSYSNGKRSGNWHFYHRNGQLSLTGQVVADSIVTMLCFKEDGTPEPDCQEEKMAAFEGGSQAWMRYLQQGVTRFSPQRFRDSEISGQVMLRFIIDQEGSVTNAEVERSSGFADLDAAALQIINSSPRWTPARQYGRRVKSYYRQSVSFVIPDE